MLRILVIILLFASGAQASEEVSRKDAKEQREFGSAFAPPQQRAELAIEVFQVLDLPLTVHQASLVKSEKGYFLKLSLANSSEQKIIGLRYALATIASTNKASPLVNRTEGFSMPPYAAESLTFKTPIKFKSKGGERLVLMLEQVISRESIWEVVKAKEAFDAYAKGDYSVLPVVLR
ncbi:MAG TPA: hypothetical protein VFY67_17305, partial [Pyrinomonadaceae bacterium]|nr:hypothetical protein [Pyrinomonadaceae bacterium]